MSDRDLNLVTSAMAVFARYGVGKTTMNDIAREAGVARQTLYNAYPGKDAILRAAVRHSGNETLRNVAAAWADQTDLNAKLQSYYDLVPLHWFDMIRTFPDAAELIDGLHTTAQAEMAEIAADWTQEFIGLIKAHAAPGSVAAQDPATTADFIYSTSINAKYGAENRAVLESRLATLTVSVLALFGQPAAT